MSDYGLFDPAVQAGNWRPAIEACYSRTWEGYDMPPHFHARTELMYVHKGWCLVHLFDYRLEEATENIVITRHWSERLGPGEFIFLERGVLHKLEVPETNYMLNVEFSMLRDEAAPVTLERLSAASPELRTLLGRGRRVLRGKDASGQLMRAMERAILEFSRGVPRDAALENVLMAELLLRLAANVKDSALKDNALGYARRAADYLAAHLDEDVRVGDVAQSVGVAAAYLQRVFKQATGLTMVEYLNQLRVEQAKRLLMFTEDAVMDVAVASGFNSRQHFFRVFNAATGMSPQQFRQAQHVRQARQLYFFDNAEDHSYDADGRRRDPDRS